MGKLTGTEVIDDERREFHFARHGEPYKPLIDTETPLRYISNRSSAACAVTMDVGATYIVFAEYDRDSGIGWLTSCNGTRVHQSTEGDAFGFSDVPPRFVVSQLTALSGLDALGRSSRQVIDAGDVDNTAIVGLLDIAALSHTDNVPLFAKPDSADKPESHIRSYDDVQHRESGYEVDAALVYAIANDWYKVKRSDGSFAWLGPDAAGTYWPLESLLPNRLNYLTDQWNRLLWPMLGAGLPSRLSYAGENRPREQPVNVLAAERIGGSLWLEVEVLKSSPCESGDSRATARGWIPAYSPQGEPVAWYYSRGC